MVSIEHLARLSISKVREVIWIEGTLFQIQPMIYFLKDQIRLKNKEKANKLRRRVDHVVLQDEVLHMRGVSSTLLQCIDGKEANYVIRKVHERVFGNHTRGLELVHKILR